ncbi:hypothetical protein DC498_25790 [Terrimonas sp.]|uniref:SIR2 family protein n=1 Tax=Terrimonas sp. TaxID=1914338 RepID=UPI000D518F31|nr:SIR2 family protein [Terrimonas sp.]PVD49289.1 hypothetical protein DC498_25790 [Terrimonas sp.]
MKTRSAFLFGAGATIDWKSPSTSDLTKILLDSGFRITDNTTRITKFIYDKLLSNGFNSSDVNFETIINVIEELALYYSKYQKEIPHSLYSCFFEPKFETELFNFSVLKNEYSSRFELQIPKGKKYDFARFAHYDQTPTELYFQYLIQGLLSDISAEVSHYSYHSESHSVIDFESEVSKDFTKWMQSKFQSSILRMYTLNYERIFKVLLEKNGIDIFEGFHERQETYIGKVSRANIPKILNDVESNIYYNLHGSAFWQVRDLDNYQLPHVEIFDSDFPHLQMNDSPATLQIEKGKNILVTNIVTGFQKAQRGMIPPIRQMQAAFDRDCCLADELFIIGYSFNDEHINQCLKTGLRHNRNLKVKIVDPNFIKNKMDEHFSIQIFPFTDQGFENMRPKKVKENLYSFHGDTFTVYTVTFGQFLKEQAID